MMLSHDNARPRTRDFLSEKNIHTVIYSFVHMRKLNHRHKLSNAAVKLQMQVRATFDCVEDCTRSVESLTGVRYCVVFVSIVTAEFFSEKLLADICTYAFCRSAIERARCTHCCTQPHNLFSRSLFVDLEDR